MVVDNLIIFSYLTVYARWIIGIVFLVAGAAKAQNVSEFTSTVQAFRVLPTQLFRPVVPFIIGLELILGSTLLIGVGVQLATATSVLLFGSFTVAILINLARQNILDCKCFGPYFKEKISTRTVIRNLIFVILCLWVWQFYDGYLALEAWFFRRTAINRPVEPFFLLTAAIIVFGISIISARMVLRNFKSATSNNVN